jgi:hypothetical protein
MPCLRVIFELPPFMYLVGSGKQVWHTPSVNVSVLTILWMLRGEKPLTFSALNSDQL